MAKEELKSQVLGYICSYVDENGYAPSYREIQKATGIKSLSTIHNYIRYLKTDGRLDATARLPRAIATNRRVELEEGGVQRVRVEVSDGGVLFLDCSLKPTGITFSGVLDASQLKGRIGNVVNCTFENG